jgi:hypothetical protein
MGQGALAPTDTGLATAGYRAYTEVRVSSRSCAHLLVASRGWWRRVGWHGPAEHYSRLGIDEERERATPRG